MLTFGVNWPMTNGTKKPAVDDRPFVSAAIGPAKFGAISSGITSLLDVTRPCDPTERMKNNPTRRASQPPYAAAIRNELSRIPALKKIKFKYL